MNADSALLNAEIPRFASTTAPDSVLFPIVVEEEEEGETRKNRAADNLAAMAEYGLAPNIRTRAAAELPNTTPDYIHAQAARLCKANKLSPGLLLIVIESEDKLPGGGDNYRRFVMGEFADFIEH